MITTHNVNLKLLRAWSAKKKAEGFRSRKWLAIKVGCSDSTINQLFIGNAPISKAIRFSIAFHTEIDEDSLFPLKAEAA